MHKPLIFAEMNHHYRTEVGTAGERVPALGMLERELEKAIVRGNDAKRFATEHHVVEESSLTRGSRVKQLAAFHLREQQKHQDLKKANDYVIHMRLWIARQNASLTPEGKIIWTQSDRKVEYDRDLVRQGATRITLRNGLMYTATNQVLDTTRMVTMHSGPGWAIYVMSFEGHLYVSPHSVGHRHHSSLLAGATVTGAGEIKVTQGKLASISNKSGHYQPDTFLLLQTIHSLVEQGLANDFQVVTMAPRNTYPGFRHFLAAQKWDDTTVECMWISEGFYGHLTNQFLMTNHLWFQPCSIPNGLKGGMYSTARGTYDPITYDDFVAYMANVHRVQPARRGLLGDRH
jgi:hypothetical protein